MKLQQRNTGGNAYLDWTGIDNPHSCFQAVRNSILGNDSLSGTGMRTDKDRLVPLNRSDRYFLKRIEFEGIGSGRIGRRNV